MRVLMQIRKEAFALRGGDTVQLTRTKKYLEKEGIQVDISTELAPDLSQYDLVHLFNLFVVEETYSQCLNAYRQKKPIVLSSIFWDRCEYLLNNPNWKVKWARRLGGVKLAKFLIDNKRFYSPAWYRQRAILKKIDFIFTTSKREIDIIEKIFKIKDLPYKAVPLAVETEIFQAGSAENFKAKYGLDNFVLCAGRFDDLKNQLKLIKIFGGTDIPLVLIGQKNPKFAGYYDACVQEAAKFNNMRILPEMSQRELADAYAAARVHVAPSWFETFGLVSLEAAAAGCNVVVTDRCPLDEYLNGLVYYCQPDNDESIRSAVEQAFHAPISDRLRDFVSKTFVWERVAADVLSSYEKILAKQ